MRLALAEAEKARGRTHPNPVVGAVLMKGSRVISCGHHELAGQPHAEVNALLKAGLKA
jgi:diaminohydroxyphosphoribosylaminopyrimidine deaminase/5-amino-6-(5-phosphoribosylamino)uracil reductase